ncbi:MAG: aldo/keto reductase [Bacilli bacterium]
MIYRESNFEEKVSLLGLGSMRLPLNANGEIDEEHVARMVKYAMDNGVTYYDHAWFYHDYKSESLMGKVLSEYERSTFYMADKMPLWLCNSEKDVDEMFEQQLKNLRTDYIDFYLVHSINEGVIEKFHKFNMADKLKKWKTEGKIKHIGFSFHDTFEVFKKAVDIFDWEFSLLQLNYMDIDHQQGIEGYEILKSRDIPVFVMEPVKGGNLANFNEEINNVFLDYSPNESIASWSIKWLANLDNVKVILSGMSNLEQMIDNVNTVSNFKKLNEDELILIEKVRKMVNDRIKVNCTGCKYCMPCPKNVNIPKAFATYNDYSMYENDKFLDWSYGLLHRDGQLPSQCVDCGICIDLCPQNLNIPELLKDVEKIDPRR